MNSDKAERQMLSQVTNPPPLPRRTFLRRLGLGAVALGPGVALVSSASKAFAGKGGITEGDAALLRFAAAAEILETDLWVQYNELGGIQDNEVPGGSGNPVYTDALSVLDGDMDQYIHDNTEDEFTHENFLNAYLASKCAKTVPLEPCRTSPGSTATGSRGPLRLHTPTPAALPPA